MLRDEVLARVDAIRAVQGDDEVAHSEEDRLHEDVLRAIANREVGDEPARLAAAALKTLELEFSRWCA